jgi:mannose-6-phosphate isomerase class I
VTDGQATITGGGEEITLEKGESAFIPAGEARKGLRFTGVYTLYAAGVGSAGRAPGL